MRTMARPSHAEEFFADEAGEDEGPPLDAVEDDDDLDDEDDDEWDDEDDEDELDFVDDNFGLIPEEDDDDDA